MGRGGGFFEGLAARQTHRSRIGCGRRTRAERGQFVDPYALPPVLGATDDYLLVEGTHRQLYERLGAHSCGSNGIDGVHFAVWAPHARRISVVGGFNAWDGRKHQMRKRIDCGLWEIFAPGVEAGAVYKYEIISNDGRLLPLKADPVGFSAELRPSTASIVADTGEYHLDRADFLERRRSGDPRRKPMTIYQVHLGSWRRGEGSRFLFLRRARVPPHPLCVDLGFTHIELLRSRSIRSTLRGVMS